MLNPLTLEEIKQHINEGVLMNPIIVYELVVEYFRAKSNQAPKSKRVVVCSRCAEDWTHQHFCKGQLSQPPSTVIVEPA